MAVELVEPVKRVEQYLYALCVMDFNNIPIPRSRLEFFAHALITGVLPEFQAETREEVYITAIVTGDYANLPLPKSRADQLLYKICLGETEIRDIELETRYEILLAYIAEHGDMLLETVLVECVNALQTIPNTVEMPVTSAMLKGKTLVNHTTDNLYNTVAPKDVKTITENIRTLKNNAEYIAIFRLLIGSDTSVLLHLYDNNWGYIQNISSNISPTKNYIKFTAPSSDEVSHMQLENQGLASFDATDVMIIEYQEGMENWDIPYFEGMQSVKMPVLTTTGKNLFKGETIEANTINGDEIYFGNAHNKNGACLMVDESMFGKTYTVSCYAKRKPANNFVVLALDENGNELKALQQPLGTEYQYITQTITIPRNTVKLLITIAISGMTRELWIKQLQIEENTTATSYEPHKSNILTVNEEVELRGIGDVKDELNLMTGELTQRLINMSNLGDYDMPKYTTHDGTHFSSVPVLKISFDLPFKIVSTGYGATNNFPLVCDKFKILGDQNGYSVDRGSYVSSRENQLFLHLIKEEVGLPTDKLITKEIVKEFLKENPIEVTSWLVEPIIKTVDLTIQDQDGNAVSCLSTFNDATHVSINAVDIIPQVDLRVHVDANTMANVASQQENVAVAQASLSDAIDAQNDDIEMTKQALDEVKGE